MTDFARINTNTGHGHAWPRPDGVKTRCGGPVICRECAADQAMVVRFRRSGADGSAAHGPVDPAQVEIMNALAHGLDAVLNPQLEHGGERRVGFFLTTFNFNEEGGRFNYISNADKIDVHTMLKDVLARIEGRMSREGRA